MATLSRNRKWISLLQWCALHSSLNSRIYSFIALLLLLLLLPYFCFQNFTFNFMSLIESHVLILYFTSYIYSLVHWLVDWCRCRCVRLFPIFQFQFHITYTFRFFLSTENKNVYSFSKVEKLRLQMTPSDSIHSCSMFECWWCASDFCSCRYSI